MIFFFKQKTAYEIKECDWSSDVCSSDLRQNIRTVCICPGTIATDNPYHDSANPFRKLRENMIPMGRLGKPEEIANLALLLASDDALFINGVAISIDGGFSSGKFISNWEEIVASATKK